MELSKISRGKFVTGLISLVGGSVLLSSWSRPLHGTPARSPLMVPARFHEKLPGKRVLCDLCFHKCVLTVGRHGICRVRKNHEGVLYSLVYGRPVGLQSDPIELEPMYHMEPGHRNMGVYTVSCNFRCKHCHNWQVSQRGPGEVKTLYYSPREVVNEAIKRGSRSISFTINEPTIFYEYMYDTAKIARGEGLLTLFHSNGAIAPAALRDLLPVMNGVVVDLKAFSDETYNHYFGGRLNPVLDTLKFINREGIWLEIVYLVIPTVNDCMQQVRAMCKWVVANLGVNVPLHFSRFQPAFRLTHLPRTPVNTLENARLIAREEGINFSTLGNVPGHEFNSTFCPGCNYKLVHRIGFTVVANNIAGGRCKSCGQVIPGIWA